MRTSPVSPQTTVKLSAAGAGNAPSAPHPGPAGICGWLRSPRPGRPIPQCFLYLGNSSGPLTLVDSTNAGNSASSGKVAGAPLYAGTYLWAVWTGADAAAWRPCNCTGAGVRIPGPCREDIGEGFANPVAVDFQAGSTVSITGAGLFIYNGAPTVGNLVIVLALSAGSDRRGTVAGGDHDQHPRPGPARHPDPPRPRRDPRLPQPVGEPVSEPAQVVGVVTAEAALEVTSAVDTENPGEEGQEDG